MTSIPSCTYCIYFDVNKMNCKKLNEIPNDIINGKKICKDVKSKDAK